MNAAVMATLAATVQAMLRPGKGLLAMDESIGTCHQRLVEAGIAPTTAMRRDWRDLLLTAPGLGEHISGVILADDTLRQTRVDGTPFAQVAQAAGLVVGIKVDTGAHALAGQAGEQVTEGLDGLRARLQAYAELGARFAKWRAVFTVDEARRPSLACMETNTHALARYAALCQEAGLVPIVEPDVLMAGDHTLARCQAVTEAVQRSLFDQLARQGVALEALLLKPNLVTAGQAAPTPDTAQAVAQATLQSVRRVVPAAVPGILFLSGGQPGPLACARLSALQHEAAHADGSAAPWRLSFSFARALQQPALALWAGLPAHRAAAQRALLHRAQCSGAAAHGRYAAVMDAAPAANTQDERPGS